MSEEKPKKISNSIPRTPPCYMNGDCIRWEVCKKLNQDCAAFRSYLRNNDGCSPEVLDLRGSLIKDIKELKDAKYDDSPLGF